jgi:hypothetical protein
MKLAQSLFGFRNDLQLDTRWWHRLAKVSFILGMLVLLVLTISVAATRRPILERKNIVPGENLMDFTLRQPPEVNAVDVFDQQPVVFLIGDNDLEWTWDIGRNIVCSSNTEHYLKALEPLTLEDMQVKEVMQNDRYTVLELDATRPTATCLVRQGYKYKNVFKLVHYEVRSSAYIWIWVENVFGILLVVSSIALLALNLYYRGLLYIIYGKQHDTAAENP